MILISKHKFTKTMRKSVGQKKPVGIITNRIVVFHKPVEGQKAMAHVAKEKRAEFLKSGRQIACTTYTEVAEQELTRGLGNEPLCHYSQLHVAIDPPVSGGHPSLGRYAKPRET
jgi:hypothetical protein